VGSNLNKRAVGVVRSANSSTTALICLEALLFHLTEVHSIGLGLATTVTDLPNVQVLLYQMGPDDFFTHNKADASSMV